MNWDWSARSWDKAQGMKIDRLDSDWGNTLRPTALAPVVLLINLKSSPINMSIWRKMSYFYLAVKHGTFSRLPVDVGKLILNRCFKLNQPTVKVVLNTGDFVTLSTTELSFTSDDFNIPKPVEVGYLKKCESGPLEISALGENVHPTIRREKYIIHSPD